MNAIRQLPERAGRAAQGLLAALVGLALVQAAIVVGVTPAVGQARVGASTPVVINSVGSPADIGAGQRLGNTVPQPQIVVATGVAAKSETEIVQRWMSTAELDATVETGLVRGGRDGTHYRRTCAGR